MIAFKKCHSIPKLILFQTSRALLTSAVRQHSPNIFIQIYFLDSQLNGPTYRRDKGPFQPRENQFLIFESIKVYCQTKLQVKETSVNLERHLKIDSVVQ